MTSNRVFHQASNYESHSLYIAKHCEIATKNHFTGTGVESENNRK